MTRREIYAALVGLVQKNRDTPIGDALADLLNLAWADQPPFPLDGFGDNLDQLRPRLAAILTGWDLVARQNGVAAVGYRDAASAVRCMIAGIEAAK